MIIALLETLRGLCVLEGGEATWMEVAARCEISSVQQLHHWRRGRTPTVDTVQALLRAWNAQARVHRVQVVMDGDATLIRLAPVGASIHWPEDAPEEDGSAPSYYGSDDV